MLIHPKKNRF